MTNGQTLQLAYRGLGVIYDAGGSIELYLGFHETIDKMTDPEILKGYTVDLERRGGHAKAMTFEIRVVPTGQRLTLLCGQIDPTVAYGIICSLARPGFVENSPLTIQAITEHLVLWLNAKR